MLTTILLITAAIVALNLVLVASIAGIRLSTTNEKLKRAAVERRWRPRLHQLLAGETTADVLLPLVRRSDRRHLLRLATAYAKRIDGIELRRLQSLGRPLLPCLRRDLASTSPEDRAKALQAYGLLGGSESTAHLVPALDDPSPIVAMMAAARLCAFGDADAIDAVVGHLDRFDLWSPSYLASMLASGGPAAAERLRACLACEGAGETTRAVAGDALRLLRDPAAAAAAAEVLAATGSREVAASCLRLLESLGTAEHRATVRPFADADDFVLRAHAMSALGALAADEGDVGILNRAIDDPSPWVSLHAARALLRAGHREVLQEAVASLRPGAAAAREVLMEEAA